MTTPSSTDTQKTSDLKNKINFVKSDISKYYYSTSKYQAVVATRVIQYLNSHELVFFLNKVVSSLKPDGFLLLSYNTKGGIFDQKEIKVPKYSYDIEKIENLLRHRFEKVIITKAGTKSMHVNYGGNLSPFDIYASNPKVAI